MCMCGTQLRVGWIVFANRHHYNNSNNSKNLNNNILSLCQKKQESRRKSLGHNALLTSLFALSACCCSPLHVTGDRQSPGSNNNSITNDSSHNNNAESDNWISCKSDCVAALQPPSHWLPVKMRLLPLPELSEIQTNQRKRNKWRNNLRTRNSNTTTCNYLCKFQSNLQFWQNGRMANKYLLFTYPQLVQQPSG